MGGARPVPSSPHQAALPGSPGRPLKWLAPAGSPGASCPLWTLPTSPPCLCLCSRDRPMPLAKEGTSDPPSPLLFPSPSGWKAITEKPPEGHEEAEDHLGPRGEGAVGGGWEVGTRDRSPRRSTGAPSPGTSQALSHCFSPHRTAGGLQGISSSQNLPGGHPVGAAGPRRGKWASPAEAGSHSWLCSRYGWQPHTQRAWLSARQGPWASLVVGQGEVGHHPNSGQGQRPVAWPDRASPCRAPSASPTSCMQPWLWCDPGPRPAQPTTAPPTGHPHCRPPGATHPAQPTSTASPWTGEAHPSTRSGSLSQTLNLPCVVTSSPGSPLMIPPRAQSFSGSSGHLSWCNVAMRTLPRGTGAGGGQHWQKGPHRGRGSLSESEQGHGGRRGGPGPPGKAAARLRPGPKVPQRTGPSRLWPGAQPPSGSASRDRAGAWPVPVALGNLPHPGL